MCELPNLTPETPPPPPTPPTPPPPPVRATVQFVPPAVVRDNEVVEEPPQPIVAELENTASNIGKTDVAGTNNGEPTELPDDKELDKMVEPVKSDKERVYDVFDIQKMPSFPGGEAEMRRFLHDNFKWPALASGITGTVVVSFVVGKNGNIEDVKILRDPGAGLGKEVVRVVHLMPLWAPGEANGNSVKVRFTLPVRLHLE